MDRETTRTPRKRTAEPAFVVGEITIDARDIELLSAIDRCGSLHSAAADLGRSYARVQRRIVELEAAVGSLTVRRRGGPGGGGTELSTLARELQGEYERFVATLDGFVDVPEATIVGRVVDRRDGFATVETAAGELHALVPSPATHVALSVRADAVVLFVSNEHVDPGQTSLRNRVAGTIASIHTWETARCITLALGNECEIVALVTPTSVKRLGLEPGGTVTAMFKATATRGAAVQGGTEGE